MEDKILTEDEEIYYELLKDYWQDGVITKKEEHHLNEMREQLEISEKRALNIEEIVKLELGIIDDYLDEDKLDLYRKLMESFARKGIIEDKKRELLDKKGDSLAIPPGVRLEMEGELYYERALELKRKNKIEDAFVYLKKAMELFKCEKFKNQMGLWIKERSVEKEKELKKEEEKNKFKELITIQLSPKISKEEEEKRKREAREQFEEEKRIREERIKKAEEEMRKKLRISELSPEMVIIEGGEFYIGSNKGDESEIPVHKVILNSFYMSIYPVSNREYSKYSEKYADLPGDLPAVNVRWFDVLKFCNWLSEKEGLEVCYTLSEVQKKNVISWILGGEEIEYTAVLDISKNGYRLPTEAEWEYSCRGGSITEYFWGDDMDNSSCWYDKSSGGKVHPPGKKPPNKFGLYDMSGNIWEWCWDSYNKKYYEESSFHNPLGPAAGSHRVRRGGSFKTEPAKCRSAFRGKLKPGKSADDLGFRVVRNVLL